MIHLILAGLTRIAVKGVTLLQADESWSESVGGHCSVNVPRRCFASSLALAEVIPRQVSVTIDADAREIAHPRALKAISFITSEFWSTSISSDTSSPQRGLLPVHLQVYRASRL